MNYLATVIIVFTVFVETQVCGMTHLFARDRVVFLERLNGIKTTEGN